MFKVVLADDEPIALEGLLTETDWEQLGFRICGAFDNGEDALAQIMKSSPELVITDIRMPGMDGLELIRRVRKLGISQPHFVVLSGYADFEYARTALRYGVSYYLLKPVIEAEWAQTLQAILNDLNAQRQQRLQDRQQADRRLSLVLGEMLRGENSIDEAELNEHVLRLDAEASGWRYIHVEGLSGDVMGISRTLAHAREALFVELHSNQAGIAVERSRSPLELAGAVYDELKRQGVNGFVSVGPAVPSLRELPLSYLAASEAAVQHFFDTGSVGPIDSETADRYEISYKLPSAEIIGELLIAVERLQEEKASGRLEALFMQFQHNLTAPEVVHMTAVHIMMKNLELLKEFGGTIDLRQRLFAFFRSEPVSLAEMKLGLHTFLKLCMGYIRQVRESGSEHPLVQAERYLQENFHKPVTVKEIAERFYIHPVYLGQAFSKKYGVSILEFVHDLRITEAKKRLLESDVTVRMIAEEVGYVHYHHFLKEFEKRAALKPVAFRSQNQCEE